MVHGNDNGFASDDEAAIWRVRDSSIHRETIIQSNQSIDLFRRPATEAFRSRLVRTHFYVPFDRQYCICVYLTGENHVRSGVPVPTTRKKHHLQAMMNAGMSEDVKADQKRRR
jgi:hypothetical protein